MNPQRRKGLQAEREAADWKCWDCGRINPAGAIFCRGCASTQDDDPEPHVTLPDTNRSAG